MKGPQMQLRGSLVQLRALEPAERTSVLVGNALEPAGRALDPIWTASVQARTPEEAGGPRIQLGEPWSQLGGPQEPAGRA